MEFKEPTIRISQIARKLDISITDIVKLLTAKGHDVNSNPNQKLNQDMLNNLFSVYKESPEKNEAINDLKKKLLDKYPFKIIDYMEDIVKLQGKKAIGLIEKEISDKNNVEVLSAKIKISGLINEDSSIINLTDNQLKALFPPLGYVFEYNFFKNYHFKIGDVLEFWTDEILYAKENQDKYKIRNYNPDLKYFGINAREIKGFKENGFTTNLDLISLDDTTDGPPFYGITDKYVIGRLRLKKGKVEPALHHRIKMWNLDKDNLLTIDGHFRLIQEPQGKTSILDCMSDKQLFEWFREYLNQIDPDYVKILDNKRSWRDKIPELFSTIDSEKLEADKIRIKRIEEKFDLIELSRTDIKTLVDNSQTLKSAFINCVDKHKEEFKEDYQQELMQYKTQIEQQKLELRSEIEKLISQKESEENLLIKLAQSIKVKKDELTNIQENKDRIIQDFSIIKEVLQGYSSKKLNDLNTNSFTVEEVINNDCDNVTTIEEFETQLMYQLSNYSLNPKFAKKIIDVISFYNAILIKDVRIGIAIAEATCNARYIIQQVEPDWLHFRNFWDNGLSEIWNLAHNSPNIFHFLLLEDINMSALECYCRPLLDVINGIRKKIPYGQTPFPQNLKILATVASFNEPEIGLPIYKNTIADWGAVCFRGNIKENFEPISKPVSKLLPTGFFHEQIIDEFDKCNILNDVNAELDNILEV